MGQDHYPGRGCEYKRLCSDPPLATESPATVLGTQAMREVDEFSAMQTLYLLDRFGVSDEFYHKLTQVSLFCCSDYNILQLI